MRSGARRGRASAHRRVEGDDGPDADDLVRRRLAGAEDLGTLRVLEREHRIRRPASVNAVHGDVETQRLQRGLDPPHRVIRAGPGRRLAGIKIGVVVDGTIGQALFARTFLGEQRR